MTQHLRLKKGALRGCVWLRPREPAALCTAGALEIFGLPPSAGRLGLDGLIGCFDEGDRAEVESMLRRALDRGETDAMEALACRGDGITHLVGMATECALDADGAVEAVCLIIRDQTEAARAERMTRLIVDHVPGMISYWDDDLICRYANAAYGEWFGRTPHQMVGIHLLELLGEARFKPIEGHIRGVLEGHPQVFETVVVKPSGQPGAILAHFVPDHDGRGVVAGYYVLIADVTELKHTEAQLRETNALLEEARAQAESAAAVKRDFLSNMSHELRTPLTSIIGFAEVLEARAGLQDDDRRSVERIHDASRTLLATINDILDFSKLEAGRVEIERRVADPADLGRRVMELFELQLQGKGLTGRFEAMDLPPFVLTDDTRVRQILLNLVGNAAKFTAAGSVQLFTRYDRERQRLRYEVHDTGPGIPDERRSRLFLPFAQVDASTTRTFGGTGLGLSICRGLAEAMGGEIGVDSVPGQGSRFWVELPCPVTQQAAERRSALGAGEAVTALTGARLLVVDDNPANRELARVICRSFGMTVLDAADGAQAAAIAAREPLDAILLDVRMPGLSGPDTARLIRSEPGPNRSTPIIAFTAEVDRDHEAEWAELFQGVLGKPMSAADVLAALTQACKPPGLVHFGTDTDPPRIGQNLTS
jgi:PAS domain S-box-containing protein